nr:MAG TPA: hypothetical protein [Caudoviricetes sp.]
MLSINNKKKVYCLSRCLTHITYAVVPLQFHTGVQYTSIF